MAFRFSRPPGFEFKAGQTVDLTLHDATGGAAGTHTFSIASAPHEGGLMITTRMRDSDYKRALGALPIGSALDIAGPFGSLTLHKDPARPALLVAGGIGITPFLSMLQQAANDRSGRRIVLLYSNRRRRDAAFLEELDAIARREESIEVLATMTARGGDAGWPGRAGRIDAPWIRSVVARLTRPIAYAAGPPDFVASMRQALDLAGVPEDDVRSEDFAGY
jgi:ferredoxin-NADP reductase